MKISINLSDQLGSRLTASAKRLTSGNVSLLVEVALRYFLDLPEAQVANVVARWQLNRKASTRDGWMRAFWIVLGEELGRRDMIDNPYAPRNYGSFYVVLLLNHHDRNDDEMDPFIPFVGVQTAMQNSPGPSQWRFERSEPPTRAAEVVAQKLRELGAMANA